jgi:hypothetical protein
VCGLLAACLLGWPGRAAAQQRPLSTQDPEPIGAGRVLIEAGIDVAHDQQYTVSGLKGNLWRLPTLGVSVGISSIAEVQIDGGLYDRLDITHDSRVGATAANPPAPLASLLTVSGTSTHDVEDAVVAMKIRAVTETAGRPSFAVRFATKLPNASNESGLGLDTTDFFASILSAKTVESVRVVGNLGVGILGDPTDGNRQNDVLTYGVSFARALTNEAEVVGEVNGRVSTRRGPPFPGTETRGLLRLGGRYTWGPTRVDAAVFFGLTTIDPTIGITAGVTYVFDAFRLP